MNGEWCYFNSYFSHENCEKIIKQADKYPSQEALVQNGIIADIRKSIIKFIPTNDGELSYILDLIWRSALDANHNHFNFHLSKLDYLQFTEYDAAYAGHYKTHKDIFWLNGDPLYHRKLSFIIQLTDPTEYDGCDFELYADHGSLNSSSIRDRGTIIFFPSFIPHRVTPILRGKRQSLVGWIDGPKWR
jgi:PKHD-type hydroxylase